jgi:uncharacterized integral membrane protein
MMTEPTGSRPDRRFKLSPRLVIGAVIGVLALVFVLQNTGRMRVHILFTHIDNPLWVWLVVLFAAGFIVGSVFPWFRRRRKKTSDASSSSG